MKKLNDEYNEIIKNKDEKIKVLNDLITEKDS
jgi:hypothetical protein